MKSSGGERGPSAGGLELLANLVRQTAVSMTPLQRMEGLRSVNARLERRRRLRFGVLVMSLLGAGALTTAAVVLVRAPGVALTGKRAIGYSINGGEIGDGGYIRSFGATGALLHFEEGTELRLMNGARGRLGSVDAHGARFAIEEGEAEVSVTPRPDARWLVDAGPFLITVRGTAFTAAWNGATERLDIHMKKGLVSVTGPLADGMMAVRAGQHLSVNIKKKEVLLRQFDGGGEAASPAPTSDLPPSSTVRFGDELAPSVRSARTSSVRASSAAGAGVGRSLPPARSWSVALAAGDLDFILRDAERRGWHRAISEADSAELAALADAARYRRRDDIARQALLAERERFPRSGRASDSAFLLGRLEEGSAQGEARALRWYDLYLKEAPSGAYSSEALGRKMTATERVRGASAARQVANEYLRRFPEGTYAGAARALLALQ